MCVTPLGELIASMSKRPSRPFETVPQSYSAPKDDRCNHDVHVVDQICREELTNGRRPSTDAHVELTCGFLGDP